MPSEAASVLPRSTFVVLLAVLCLAIAGGVGAVVFQQWSPYKSGRIGGPFSMAEMTGRPVTEKALLGKPTALFFGFTFCPDVCPTTLLSLSTVMRRMGPEADRLNVVFATVDPERDTAEQMRLYLSSFDPRIRGFVGTPAQVAAMTNTYHVVVRRVPTADGSYTVDHSAAVLLFDKAGAIVGQLSYGEAEDEMFAKLETLVRPAVCVRGGPPRVDLWNGAKMQDLCASG